MVLVVVVVTVDFFNTTPSNFSFGLSFVVRLPVGFSFWFWLDGPAISPRAARFLFAGAAASDLASVRTVLARVVTVEVALLGAVVVDVGLVRVIKREVCLALAFSVSFAERVARATRRGYFNRIDGSENHRIYRA